MKNILCYGDSNTWGCKPGVLTRLPANVRWTGVLAEMLGDDYRVIEDGINGRSTAWDDPSNLCRNGISGLGYSLYRSKPLDLVIVMLGTNDLNHTDAEGYYHGIKLLAKQILNAMPESEAPVVFALATNLREHVGLEKTLTNCIDAISIPLSRQDLQQENYMETLRATLKRRNSSDYVRYNLCNSGTLSIEEQIAMSPTFCISYTGKVGDTKLDFVEKNNIYRMISRIPMLDMKAQNGWFNVNVTQDNLNNPLTDMLKNAFHEIGLEVHEETKTIVTPENGRITIKQV